MVVIKGLYQGDKHCELNHGPSGTVIATDAPKDNNGKGEAFSPTDLVAAAMGSCMMTVMAIYAEKENINLSNSHFKVEKIMTPPPRRIQSLNVEIYLPKNLTNDERTKLETIANECPVKRSIHPDVQVPVVFYYTL